MLTSFYLKPPATSTAICRGDIYGFVPVHWLNPPVYILRNWQVDEADVLLADEVADAFRVKDRDNREFIITEGKTRFVIVFSHDIEIRKERTYVLVVPVYTINADQDDPLFLDNLRQYRIYNAFYLPPESSLGINESYADFRRLRPLHRGFLQADKRYGRLTSMSMPAMLTQFSKFLLRT